MPRSLTRKDKDNNWHVNCILKDYYTFLFFILYLKMQRLNDGLIDFYCYRKIRLALAFDIRTDFFSLLKTCRASVTAHLQCSNFVSELVISLPLLSLVLYLGMNNYCVLNTTNSKSWSLPKCCATKECTLVWYRSASCKIRLL